MKILVTGGAGYVGTELVRVLASNESVSAITILDSLRRPNYGLFVGKRLESNESDKLSFIRGDILDSRTMRQLLEGVDVVYHLAAKVTTPFSHDDPHSFEQTNHWGTAELSYILEDLPGQKIVYLSSLSVYGLGDNVADENIVARPTTAYGISKLRGEEYLRRLADRSDLFILRVGNVFGHSDSMRFESVINRYAFEANYSGRINVEGNGLQYRSFISVSQLVQVMDGLLTKSLQPGTYNVTAHNEQILAISHMIKDIFPGLEMIFVNQQFVHKGIQVTPNPKIRELIEDRDRSLESEIYELCQAFSFSGTNNPGPMTPRS